MVVADVPEWCRWRLGRQPLLLVAPHGGQADTSTARALATKVNDVHTADLTWELATALDAGVIVNPVIDRNRLDLNRISQLSGNAVWFPMLIEHLLAPLLDTHPSVEVLFVHGWNVIQPKCDLGVGASFATEEDALHLPRLTAAPHYIQERLGTLRTACAAVGVQTTFGERYPASHRNNALQLFRRDGSRPHAAAPRIATWAASGRLNAVQLELGVPLRWPGRLRQAFTRTLVDTLRERKAHGQTAAVRMEGRRQRASRAQRDQGTAGVVALRSPSAEDGEPVRSAMLVAYDARAALGLMASVSIQPNGQIGGRLLVFSHGQTMALFTGEDPTERARVIGGPTFITRDRSAAMAFAGPLLEVRDAAAYVRLEEAFRQSRLIEAHVAVAFTPIRDGRYGRVHGRARLDGVTHEIDTFGFRDVPIFLRRPGRAFTRCAVAAAFGDEIGLHAATTDDEVMRWALLSAEGAHTSEARTRIDEARAEASPAPARLMLESPSRQLLLTPLNHMQIRRPLPGGDAEMIFLGLARCELESHHQGYGFYEYVRPVAQGPDPSP